MCVNVTSFVTVVPKYLSFVAVCSVKDFARIMDRICHVHNPIVHLALLTGNVSTCSSRTIDGTRERIDYPLSALSAPSGGFKSHVNSISRISFAVKC